MGLRFVHTHLRLRAGNLSRMRRFLGTGCSLTRCCDCVFRLLLASAKCADVSTTLVALGRCADKRCVDTHNKLLRHGCHRTGQLSLSLPALLRLIVACFRLTLMLRLLAQRGRASCVRLRSLARRAKRHGGLHLSGFNLGELCLGSVTLRR